MMINGVKTSNYKSVIVTKPLIPQSGNSPGPDQVRGRRLGSWQSGTTPEKQEILRSPWRTEVTEKYANKIHKILYLKEELCNL